MIVPDVAEALKRRFGIEIEDQKLEDVEMDDAARAIIEKFGLGGEETTEEGNGTEA
jgi:hypothetical protein